MDSTQIFFFVKRKNTNFEVFINESVSSKANKEALKSGHTRQYCRFFDETFIIKYRYSEQIHFSDQVQPPAVEGCTSKSSRVCLNFYICQTG